jgi:hypothetical protein
LVDLLGFDGLAAGFFQQVRVVFVDGSDVVALLEDVVADALRRFGQGVFVDGLQAVVVFVGFFVGRDAVIGCVEGALEGGYGGGRGVGGCCEGLLLSLTCLYNGIFD